MVIATFKLDRNLETAAQDVRDRVNTLGRRLPEDATPPVVQKFDNDSTPVLTIALTADRSIRELTELADKTARVATRTRRWCRRGARRWRTAIARSIFGSTPNVLQPIKFRSRRFSQALEPPER